MGDTKLERFLSKNQLTKRKLVNFEFWINTQNMTNPTIVSPVKMEYGF